MMKSVLGRIFAFWTLIVFISTLLIAVVFIAFCWIWKEPLRTERFRIVSKIWMQFFFFVIGCRLKVKGVENFNKNERYVITSNHNSFMDVPLITPFVPGPNKTIAKKELSKIPLFGFIYKTGSILVDRKDSASRKKSYDLMKAVLAQQMHMCIYPEGTRNKTGMPLKSFHDGAFSLAIETQTKVLPAIIFGTYKVLPWDKNFYFWPGKMEIHFLKPIEVGGYTFNEINVLKEKVFKIMHDYYVANK